MVFHRKPPKRKIGQAPPPSFVDNTRAAAAKAAGAAATAAEKAKAEAHARALAAEEKIKAAGQVVQARSKELITPEERASAEESARHTAAALKETADNAAVAAAQAKDRIAEAMGRADKVIQADAEAARAKVIGLRDDVLDKAKGVIEGVDVKDPLGLDRMAKEAQQRLLLVVGVLAALFFFM